MLMAKQAVGDEVDQAGARLVILQKLIQAGRRRRRFQQVGDSGRAECLGARM